jgi:CRISPR-associated protein Cas2
MKGKGIHLQYSVFYCYLSQKEVASIIEDIRSLIDINQDDVRFYPLIKNFKAIVLGRGAHIPDGVDIYLG